MSYLSTIHYHRLLSKLLVPDSCKSLFGSGKYILPIGIKNRLITTEASLTDGPHVNEDETPSELVGDPTTPQSNSTVPCPENSKLMKVAIIGVPNAGKSTMINALTNFDVCPVSPRPHTTRHNQKAVYLDENTQLVFVDTPGLVNVKEIKKFSFTPEFVYGPEKSIGTSHLIAVIHDVSNAVTRDKLDFRIRSVLEKFPYKKSILVLNKVDTVKKKSTLLDTIKYLTCGIVGGQPLPVRTFEEKRQSHRRLDTEVLLAKAKKRYMEKKVLEDVSSEEDKALVVARKFFTADEIRKDIHKTGWPNFNDIFMVSALNGDGIHMLRRYLVVNAIPDNWLYDSETLTDVPPQKLIIGILRSKLLEHLPQEIPFKIVPVLEYFDEHSDEGVIKISIQLRCPKERYRFYILGTGGNLIRRIIDDTERTFSSLMNRAVNLTLHPIFDKNLLKKE